MTKDHLDPVKLSVIHLLTDWRTALNNYPYSQAWSTARVAEEIIKITKNLDHPLLKLKILLPVLTEWKFSATPESSEEIVDKLFKSI